MATFRLDISTLSGTNVTYAETPLQERGQTIQCEWVQAGANQNMILHGYAVRGVPGEVMEVDNPLPNIASTSFSAYGIGFYGSGLYGSGTLSGTGLFVLDVSTLGGSPNISSVHTPFQDRGRGIQIEWIQSGSNRDMRLHGYAVRAVPAEVHSMEIS